MYSNVVYSSCCHTASAAWCNRNTRNRASARGTWAQRTDPVAVDVEDTDKIRAALVVPDEAGHSSHILGPAAVIRRLGREELDDGSGQSLWDRRVSGSETGVGTHEASLSHQSENPLVLIRGQEQRRLVLDRDASPASRRRRRVHSHQAVRYMDGWETGAAMTGRTGSRCVRKKRQSVESRNQVA